MSDAPGPTPQADELPTVQIERATTLDLNEDSQVLIPKEPAGGAHEKAEVGADGAGDVAPPPPPPPYHPLSQGLYGEGLDSDEDINKSKEPTPEEVGMPGEEVLASDDEKGGRGAFKEWAVFIAARNPFGQDRKKLVRDKPQVSPQVHEYAMKLMSEIDPQCIDDVLKA